jgi:hypothetical protein
VKSRHSGDRRVAQRAQLSAEKPPPEPNAPTDGSDDPIRRELERIALSPAESGREALAKVTALRTLERWNRPARNDYPVDDDGRFHPCGPEWWDLDRPDTDETRERWRRAWEGERRLQEWRAGER